MRGGCEFSSILSCHRAAVQKSPSKPHFNDAPPLGNGLSAHSISSWAYYPHRTTEHSSRTSRREQRALANEHPIGVLMQTPMESLKSMIDVNTILGDPVETPRRHGDPACLEGVLWLLLQEVRSMRRGLTRRFISLPEAAAAADCL